MNLLRPVDYADLARRSVRGWVDDSAPTMGAALAFYTLLTLAPLLMVVLGIAGYVVGREEAHAALVGQVAAMLGEQAAMGIENLIDFAGMKDPGATPAFIGTVAMLIASTTIFAELRADLDRIWRYRPADVRGWLKPLLARGSAFLMVMAIGLLLVASMLASTFLAAMGSRWFSGSAFTLHAIEFLTSFVVITLLFAAIYKILPSRKIAWGDVWVGAAVTSLLFWVGKLAIAYYIGRAAVDSTFGAAGALVAVILWVYYSAQVFFLGAEFTKEYALFHGSRKHERAGRRLSDMNATYEDLIERAKRVTGARRHPLFGK